MNSDAKPEEKLGATKKLIKEVRDLDQKTQAYLSLSRLRAKTGRVSDHSKFQRDFLI